MKNIILLAVIFLSQSSYGEVVEKFISMDTILPCTIRTIISSPDKNVKTTADMIYFIGYGDRADNHAPLFQTLNAQGIRVISYDYPSHGKTRCGSLNDQDYTSLSKMAEEVELKTREDHKRPLFVAGWSTGGLLALRMVQNTYFHERFIKGLILIAPGVSVYALVGGDGIIRQETLLRNPNPPHFGPPKPVSPLLTPIFSSTIMFNGVLARSESLPANIPSLVLIGGEKDDMYAKTPVLKKWINDEKAKGSNLAAIQCGHSMHEMDNEIEPIGSTVRTAIKDFVIDQTKILKINDQTVCKIL